MIFTILQNPIRLLPQCISELIQMFSSLKRIEKYLFAEEMKSGHVMQVYDEESQIVVKI
jgi:hypothetical protein